MTKTIKPDKNTEYDFILKYVKSACPFKSVGDEVRSPVFDDFRQYNFSGSAFVVRIVENWAREKISTSVFVKQYNPIEEVLLTKKFSAKFNQHQISGCRKSMARKGSKGKGNMKGQNNDHS